MELIESFEVEIEPLNNFRWKTIIQWLIGLKVSEFEIGGKEDWLKNCWNR